MAVEKTTPTAAPAAPLTVQAGAHAPALDATSEDLGGGTKLITVVGIDPRFDTDVKVA
jgi:hypothetical protein